jgi:hypothetical protein
MYNTLNQEEARILSQLRTDHISLNDSLVHIRVEDSTMCIYNTEIETAQHFLFYCPRWTDKHRSFKETMRER